MRLCRQFDRTTSEFTHYRIAMALVAALILNNFFGTSFVIYSVAPIGWLLLGWLSARGLELQTVSAAEPRSALQVKKIEVGV
jgi:hypothetical protein